MVIPLFRRRLTWRRTLFLTSAFFLFWILVFTLTPITSPLPPYTGPHEVGILDFETEVRSWRVVHDAVLKETGEKAFELSTLAITLYYPTTPSPTPRPWARPWLPQPISLIGTGYARLANIYFPPLQAVFTLLLWLFGSSTVIPGVVDAPVLSGAERVLVDETSGAGGMGRIMKAAMLAHERQVVLREEEEDSESSSSSERVRGGDSDMGKLPCVVFTHGMAGMSQSYSHYLGSIASHGYVVAAVEHRDGSGPGTVVHYPDGKERKVWHMKLQDLEHDPPMTDLDLKAAQLAFREAEIAETISLFHTLHQGNTSTLTQLKPSSPSTAIHHFKNRLDLSAITVAGHSYGATGALQAMHLGSPTASDNSTPLINGGIALDPGKGSGPLNTDIDVPILVLQSGQWTEKQTDFYGQGKHFAVVRDLVQNMRKGWFMTLTGSAHPSCTDAPLIVPWIMKMVTGTTLEARVALKEYVDVSVEFLQYLRDGKRTGVLASSVTSVEGPLGGEEERGKVRGREGAAWEVHVVPEKEEGQ